MSQAVSAGIKRRLLGALGVCVVLTVAIQAPGNAVVAPILPDQPPGSSAEALADSASGSAKTGLEPGLEQASPRASASATDPLTSATMGSGTGNSSSSAADESDQQAGVSVWTTLRASAQDALNAHTSDLSAPQLLGALGTPGTLTVNLRVDPAVALPGVSMLDSAWVSCPRESWCGPGQVVTIAGLDGAQGPLQWSDYTGSVWDRSALGAIGRIPLTQTPGNSLHVIQDPAAAPGTAGATTWAAQLWPTITDPDLLPQPGQVLKVHSQSGDEGPEASLAVTTPKFPVSVPVVNEATIGTISADTLTTGADGRLALSLWRPQSLGDSADSGVKDMAGLHYGLLISDGSAFVACSPQRYSAGVGLTLATDATGNPPNTALPLRDSAPVDLPLDQANPIGFTLDIGGCLADASQQGTELGSSLQATILAAASAETGASTDVLTGGGGSSSGVSYRLVVPGR